MSLERLKIAWWSRLLQDDDGRRARIVATALAVAVVGYLAWKITESPNQAVQFTFNGLSVGAVYALLAMGFTIVYSTVWFFDLYYGAAAAIGAYGVFYLRSQDGFGGHDYTNPYVNAVLAVVTAGVVAWALYEAFFHRLRPRYGKRALYAVGGFFAGAAGVYMGLILTFTDVTNVLSSPAISAVCALAVAWAILQGLRRVFPAVRPGPLLIVAVIAGVTAGGYAGYLIGTTPGTKLYVSWGVSCLMAGIVAVAFYRGLYLYMRKRARSPLIMLVATLGILLAITAVTSIIFETNPRPLPAAFGSAPWTILDSNIKGFNIFTIGVALAGFVFLLFLLKMTSFGKAARAIGDDEDVAKVVGINTTFIIAIVFFIGAVFAAMAGLLSGHDTAIQPRMGLLLLLKGWIASVVGGIGNLYGAIVGGFALGMIEQFGIWDLAGEWKDIISFIVLILFLSFWPKGLLPRE